MEIKTACIALARYVGPPVTVKVKRHHGYNLSITKLEGLRFGSLWVAWIFLHPALLTGP